MCHSSSVLFEERPSDPTRTELLCGVEAPPYFTFSRQCAFSLSHLSMRADVSQRQLPFCFATTSKNLISHLLVLVSWHPRRHLHSRIFGDAPAAWQCRNWQASGASNKPGRLSVFRRSRPSVIKYLCRRHVLFVRQLSVMGTAASSAISKARRDKPRCKSCFSKLSMRGMSHKSWCRLARKHLL